MMTFLVECYSLMNDNRRGYTKLELWSLVWRSTLESKGIITSRTQTEYIECDSRFITTENPVSQKIDQFEYIFTTINEVELEVYGNA